MTANPISLVSDEDGGNPRNPKDIIRQGAQRYTIRPFSEDGDANYKFRLEVDAVNLQSKPINLDLTIDWQDARFNPYREVVYCRNGQDYDWRPCSLMINGPLARGLICLQPGETHLCLSPRYGYGDYLRLLEEIPSDDFLEKHYLGNSPGGRPLWGISCGAATSKHRRSVLIVARIHPYESAGSFCVEGMLDRLKSDPGLSRRLAARNTALYLIPMANPDGVFDGLCKLTAQDGIDLSKSTTLDHPALAPIVRWIDQIEPSVYVELHNWMLPDWDGIYYMNRYQAWQFMRRFNATGGTGKAWKLFFRHKLFSVPKHGLKKYCEARFNAMTAVLEFPWRHRSTCNMRELGVKTFRVLVGKFS